MDKTIAGVAEAVADIPDGATVMIGGFGGSGSPIELIHALIARFKATGSPKNLTVINNNAGNGKIGLAGLIDHDMVAGRIFTLEQPFAQFILHPTLQQTAQRASTKACIVANLGNMISGAGRQLDCEAQFFHPLVDVVHQQHHNLTNLRASQRLEDDNLVDPVDKLRTEHTLE